MAFARGSSLAGVRTVPRTARPLPQPVEEVLHLRKETRRFRMGFIRGLLLELVQQFFLPFRKLLGRLDDHLHVHVAGSARAQDWHALSVETEAPPGLSAFR